MFICEWMADDWRVCSIVYGCRIDLYVEYLIACVRAMAVFSPIFSLFFDIFYFFFHLGFLLFLLLLLELDGLLSFVINFNS